MRVIAGSARRLQLKTPSGKNTRPTSDKIKETLFNILQTEIPNSRFLDLFSGSGGIGIEALSRGAEEVVFVEFAKDAIQCIKANIAHTHFEDASRVMTMEAMQALRRLDQVGQPFSVIFIDPPYRKDWEKKILPYLLTSSLVKNDTLIVVETAIDTEIEWMELLSDYSDQYSCEVERIKEYKTNRHVFLRVREKEETVE